MGAEALAPAPRSTTMVWLERAPSRLVTTVEVVGELLSAAFKHHHIRERAFVFGRVNDHQVAGGNTVAGFQNQARLEGEVIDERAVLAAQILDGPIVALRVEGEVLAREAGVFGETQVGGAGAAHGKALSGEGDGLGLAVGSLDH